MTETLSDAAPAEETKAPAASGAMAFSLGGEEAVLNRQDMMECLDCWEVSGMNGRRYYQPPLSMALLSKAGNATSHHSSAFRVKVNQLLRDFIPHPMLDRTTFEGIALDQLVLGNFYLERIDNMAHRPMKLRRSLARYTRRGVDEGEFVFLAGFMKEHWFKPGSIFHGWQPWLDQEIYGVPEYLSALDSAFLNKDATLFRRRYYINGAHAGFIMYVGEGGLQEGDADALRTMLKGTKGVGNFKSVFVHLPNGKKDSIQILHPGEAAAKDEFVGMKGTTRDDVLAAHRVPPQLMGVVPANAGGFGDVEKADDVFYRNEIQPLQQRFLAVNDWLGVEVVRFRERQKAA